MTTKNTHWSDELKQQTLTSIEDLQVNPLDGKLHLKNLDKRFGYISLQDLLRGKLMVTDKHNQQTAVFTTTGALLGAGWVID